MIRLFCSLRVYRFWQIKDKYRFPNYFIGDGRGDLENEYALLYPDFKKIIVEALPKGSAFGEIHFHG